MRAGKVHNARFAKLRGRGRKGVPDETIDAVTEVRIGARLERRGIRGPVGHHVRKCLDRGQRPAVSMRGHGGLTPIAATDRRRPRPPKLALWHIIAAPKGQGVGLGWHTEQTST